MKSGKDSKYLFRFNTSYGRRKVFSKERSLVNFYKIFVGGSKVVKFVFHTRN